MALPLKTKQVIFKNTYRFMESAIVNSKLVDLVFTGVKWHVDFEPTVASIMRLKSQAQANAEEPTFPSSHSQWRS
jgi:hypothetical protein